METARTPDVSERVNRPPTKPPVPPQKAEPAVMSVPKNTCPKNALLATQEIRHNYHTSPHLRHYSHSTTSGHDAVTPPPLTLHEPAATTDQSTRTPTTDYPPLTTAPTTLLLQCPIYHSQKALMKNIFLETFGCQMNVLDSELVENQLRVLGYQFTPDPAAADVILYNTCSVREHSEQKVWSRLGALKERKTADPSLVIGVIGCMAERDGVKLMKRMPQVDLMCGPGELDQLPHLLENVLATGKQQHALAGNTARRS